jgi:rhodanese-related sulfurtransferase
MMTTPETSFVPASVSPNLDSSAVRQAVAGFVAGYGDTTRQLYSLDLRPWLHWCDDHDLRVLDVRRGHIDLFARSLEQDGKAGATVVRRLSKVTGFYRYCFEEQLIPISLATHVRCPRVDYEWRGIQGVWLLCRRSAVAAIASQALVQALNSQPSGANAAMRGGVVGWIRE